MLAPVTNMIPFGRRRRAASAGKMNANGMPTAVVSPSNKPLLTVETPAPVKILGSHPKIA
jgi:hypothetical protein